MTLAIETAIAGVVGVTPSNCHTKYWDAIAGAIITYLTTNLKCKTVSDTIDPKAAVTGIPDFYLSGVSMVAPGLALASDIRAAIALADKTSHQTVHGKCWAAIGDTVIKFIGDHYVSVLSTGVASGSTPLIAIVT